MGMCKFYNDYKTSNRALSDHGTLKIMSITLYSIVFALGTIGNGLVIWIAGFRMKNTISATWFLNLAIADFLCCASLPLRIAEWVYILSDIQVFFCLLTILLFSINVNASVLLLTAMSIDRYISVIWPFWAKFHRTSKLVKITVAIIWVFSLLLTGLIICLNAFYFNDVREWCILYHNVFDRYGMKQIVQLLRLSVMFAIPFLVILISYVTIFLKLRQKKRPQRSQRSYRIITAVILCFFICWFPYYIWLLTPQDKLDYIHFHIINNIIINLACLNSCINPIIYVFMGQDFKHGFLRSIPFRLEKALSEQPNDLCREQEDFEHACTTVMISRNSPAVSSPVF
ncbi:C3a anaphylatoxin chemotactic receptor-like [Eleutherodactylus coqui]|uniref:C3a anaphylatoxin chemotactic receptor-like n=1 Tax=Eleutherodactylus coqui TaxID=57060 RepID=UPI003462EADD